jgi:hypothetical protein
MREYFMVTCAVCNLRRQASDAAWDSTAPSAVGLSPRCQWCAARLRVLWSVPTGRRETP